MHRLPWTTIVWLVLALAISWPLAARADEPRGLHLGGGSPLEDVAGRRTILCIGINGYDHPAYGPLRCATADARALASTFEELGYQVTLMVDDDPDLPAHLIPTYRNLDDQIHRFCRASTRQTDTLIICFSGHGDVVDGQSALVPLDYREAERTLTLGALFDAMKRSRAAKKLLVLDACRSAKRDPVRTLRSGFLQSLGQTENVVVLSGCGADQASYEDPDLQHGRLTKTLVDGLAGAAFGEDREFLFGHELWGYVERTFHDRNWVAEQSPTMFGTWNARVRFDIARREVEPPPPISGQDREIFDLTLCKADEEAMAEDYPACVNYCVTALRILPRHPDALARRGFAYANLGYVDKAFQDAQAVLERDPRHLFALVVRAHCALARGNPQVARLDMTRAIGAFAADSERWIGALPPVAGASLWLAFGYIQGMLGGTEDAQLEAYARVLAMRGVPAELVAQALVNRGLLHSARGRMAEAIADFTQVLERAEMPPLQVAWAAFDRGLAYAGMQQYAKAVADYTRVIELDDVPGEAFARALVNRAMIYEQQGRTEEAFEHYGRVLAMEGISSAPKAWAALARGGRHLVCGRYEEAFADYARVPDLPGAPPELVAQALGNQGGVRMQQGRLDDAVEEYDRCLAVSGVPPHLLARALNLRGISLQALGRAEDAVGSYGRILEMNGAPAREVGEALVRTGIVLYRLGRSVDAVPFFERVIALDDAHPNSRALALSARGVIHAEAGRAAPAMADLDRALATRGALTAARILVWVDRVKACASLGRLEEAVTDVLTGAGLAMGDADIVWLDGFAHMASEEWVAMAAAFERALVFGPPPLHVLGAVEELRYRYAEPPETRVVLAWLRMARGEAPLARADLAAYVADHPQGALADRAREVLAGGAVPGAQQDGSAARPSPSR